jgi:hypothetical protein
MMFRLDRHLSVLVGVAIALLVATAACGRTPPVPLPLSKVADVPLSGGATRWDYASLDRTTHTLFLAHMGDGAVTVFDTRRHRVLADIAGTNDVHGVLAIPELGCAEFERSFLTNELLRQYLPKGLDLSGMSQAKLNSIARQLNERPRKTLGYETPAERYRQCVASIS